MFTGLVEAMGSVRELRGDGAGRRLVVSHPFGAVPLGDSVAVNGTCLTVVEATPESLSFDVGPETLRLTSLGALREGGRVNLERALLASSRLGGHMVQGHVDGLGRIAEKRTEGEWVFMSFDAPEALSAQMVPKGSIAVDGVSLTLVEVTKGRFSVMLIPHTLEKTVLGFKEVGDPVNLETDLLAKYVFRAMEHYQGRTSPPELTPWDEDVPGKDAKTRPVPTRGRMVPTERQTLTYLRTLFEERGILPKNKLGQNFLIDLNLIDLAVKTSEITHEDLVLEVGAGTGSLTMKLVEKAGALVTVEIDPPFAALTEDVLNTHFAINEGRMKTVGARREHVRLHSGDVLEGKNTLNPVVVRSIRDLLASSGAKRVKLVANLPYAVAVPVMSNLLLSDLPVERMVGMIQWELAERLMAAPNTKDYGSLAVLVQSLATVSLVRKVPPTVFHPRPKVDSAIVMIKPDAAKRAQVGDPNRLRRFLRDLYVHRRKNLRGALATMPSGRLEKADVDARLATLGIDGAARAEALGLEDHLRLSREFGTDSGEDA